MAKENVLSRMLEVGLTSEEIRKLLKTTSFPTSGTLDVRAANLRDALLTAEIPIRRVLQKAVLPDEMCKVARLSSGGSERVLRGRLAEWFEATFEHQAAGDDADEDDGDATEDDDDGQGLTDDATVSFVQRNDLEAEVAKATSLSRSRVARELAEANGNTLLRNVFRDEWPTNFTVARVQREELYSRVAVATGMTVSEVRVGLVDAYGNSHVRTVLFPEDGGGQDETDDDDEDEDLSDSHEGDDGSSDHHARERSTQASEGRTNDDVLEDIRNLDDAELRDFWFEIGGEGPDPGPCYDYQTHGISRVEAGEGASPPVSGILHYPTGAGKTRVGMELIARALHRDPHHRFVWVTDRKLLIRQTMTRMAELARLFPAKTSFTWAADADEIKAGEDGANVVFMTRATLTQVLKQAGDGRTMHAWKEMLAAGVPMTLIYDECHQLGADKLQENWRRFHESVVTPVNARWRTIGLSATPVPTSAESHRLLRKYIFPQRPKDAPSTCHDYPFHFFHRVRNETLIASGVLCPINLVLDREGGFDFPAALLKEVIGVLRPPGPNASRLDVQDYALKFNKGVLSDSRIIEWLADRLGRSIATLGKTIVFVPTIAAANRLVALLHQRFPMIRGLVAAVHSRMAEIAVPGQEGETVHRVLDRFRSLGDKPSILVNVEMLTEGFDDPKIQSVVLARLTMSTNRFWQMIGRGTRGGPKGTTSCNVIDPVKLVRVYDYFRGYQPSLTGDVDVEFEDLEQDDGGDGRLSPQVPAVLLPPDPRACHYQVDPALGRIHAQVAAALGDFLAGGSLTEAKAVEVARLVSITFAPGIPTLVPSSEAFAPLTAAAVVLGEVSALESRTKNDLSWFRRRLPPAFDEPLLRLHLRMLRAIEQLSVWTESDFAMAQMSGAYQRAIQGEAHAAPPSANTAEAAVASVVQPSTLSPCEGAVVDIGLALAAVDGRVHPSAVIVVVESLRRMFGRAPTDELRSAVDLRRASGSDPVPLLRGEFPMRLRQLLIFQLAEVAGADGIVTPAERDHLIRTARELGVADGFVEAVLGDVNNAVPSAVAAAPSPTCSSCAFDLPTAALFCPSCGFRRS